MIYPGSTALLQPKHFLASNISCDLLKVIKSPLESSTQMTTRGLLTWAYLIDTTLLVPRVRYSPRTIKCNNVKAQEPHSKPIKKAARRSPLGICSKGGKLGVRAGLNERNLSRKQEQGKCYHTRKGEVELDSNSLM